MVGSRETKDSMMLNLDDAIVLAVTAHRGQTDKGGAPYILHPLRVMLACDTNEQRIAAVLHDTVEDCGIALDTVRDSFGAAIADAVDALTRREGETYEAFIERCAANPIARTVKLADLADNMDWRRLGREPNEKDRERLLKYERAQTLLIARV